MLRTKLTQAQPYYVVYTPKVWILRDKYSMQRSKSASKHQGWTYQNNFCLIASCNHIMQIVDLCDLTHTRKKLDQ